MPKINSAGTPSYDGADADEVGTLTNATGTQFVPVEPNEQEPQTAPDSAQPVDEPVEQGDDKDEKAGAAKTPGKTNTKK